MRYLNYLKELIFLKSKEIELYKTYLDYYDKQEDYMPDDFIRYIHGEYINKGNIKLPHPLYATWDITNLCNLNCIFCSASTKQVKTTVSSPLSINITEKIIKWGIKYISIRGGEPTIVNQLPEIVEKLVNNNVFVEIVSNGLGFTPEFFDKIKNLNKNMIRIKISLDSPIEKENDVIRGKDSYKNAIEATKNIRKYGWNFRIQMVVVNSNKHRIYDMYKLVEKLNAKSFGVYLVLPFGRGEDVDRVYLDENILNQLIKIKQEEKTTKFEKIGLGLDEFRYFKEIYEDKGVTAEESYILSLLKCNGAKTRISIDANGDCYPCDLMKYNSFKMGNILKTSLSEIWDSNKALEFNKINRKTKNECKSCTYLNCNTGCMALNYVEGSEANSLIPNCEIEVNNNK